MFKWLFKKKGCAKHMNNKLEVIGIDHGWSMMKTISQVFVTGVKEITTTPALFGDVLEYEGKFYKVGTVRQAKGLFLNYKKNRRLMQYFFKIRELV